MMRIVATAVFALALLMLSALPAGAVTSAQLKAKALSISNFPTGWSVDNSALAKPNTGRLTGFNAHNKHEVKVRSTFRDGQLPSLSETLETGSNAVALYGKINKILSACKQVSFFSGGQTAQGTIGAMSLPTVGQKSSAFAMAVTYKGINLGVDIVIFETGPYVGSVLFENYGSPATNLVQAFVTEALNKIEGKPTTPPTTF